jgi:DCC1-like thiol-disulfide oxidoreductase
MQLAEGRPLAEQLGINPDRPDSFALVANGQSYVNPNAALRIAGEPPRWQWTWLFHFIPRVIRDEIYDADAHDCHAERAPFSENCAYYSGPMRTDPAVPAKEYLDGFGNLCHVIHAPAGDITLSSDFLIHDDGSPDEAWSKFGSHPKGWPLVQAICGYVHEHLQPGFPG